MLLLVTAAGNGNKPRRRTPQRHTGGPPAPTDFAESGAAVTEQSKASSNLQSPARKRARKATPVPALQ